MLYCVVPWLAEFNDVVLCCSMHSRTTLFRRLVQPTVQGKSLFSVMGQEILESLSRETNEEVHE